VNQHIFFVLKHIGNRYGKMGIMGSEVWGVICMYVTHDGMRPLIQVKLIGAIREGSYLRHLIAPHSPHIIKDVHYLGAGGTWHIAWVAVLPEASTAVTAASPLPMR